MTAVDFAPRNGDRPRALSADITGMDTELRHNDVMRQLDRLAMLERQISDRRNRLHDDIDELYLAAPLDSAQTALLDELEDEERSVSRQRRRLHETIDELRAEIGLPRWRDQHELDTAA